MWRVEYLNETVRAELDAQPRAVQAHFARIVGLIQEFGLAQVGAPYVKPIEGKLWEMRLKGRDTIARALYVTVVDQRIVVVRVFTKKTQKTPAREIKLAQQRAKEITP